MPKAPRGKGVREELITLRRELVDEKKIARALALFDSVWETMSPREQARVLRLLVLRVDYDGGKKRSRSPSTPPGSGVAEELEGTGR